MASTGGRARFLNLAAGPLQPSLVLQPNRASLCLPWPGPAFSYPPDMGTGRGGGHPL